MDERNYLARQERRNRLLAEFPHPTLGDPPRSVARRIVTSEYKLREPEWLRWGEIKALAARALGRPATGDAIAFEGITIPELAASRLAASRRHHGHDIESAAGVVRLAMSSSDFPLALADVVTSVRDARLAEASPAYLGISNEVIGVKTTKHAARIVPPAQVPPMQEVAELQEIPIAAIGDGGEDLEGTTYGLALDIGERALINDDVGFLASVGEGFAHAQVELENRITLAQLVGGAGGNGATLADGVQLIAAARGNIGSAGAMSLAVLSEARAAIMRKVGRSGAALNASADVLVVPPESITAAEALVAQLTPAQATRFRVVADASLTGTAWYAVASGLKPLRHARISAARPMIGAQRVWETGGLRLKIVHSFAAGAVEWS
ncbi:MAG: hypothetical protein WEF50_04650 [Myxococcota bacterium]